MKIVPDMQREKTQTLTRVMEKTVSVVKGSPQRE